MKAALAAARPAVARTVLTRARPLGDRRFDEQGHCAVCGRTGRMVFSSWVIPREMVEEFGDPAVVHAYRRRESMFCAGCGSSLRVRRLAEVLVATAPAGARRDSVKALVHDPRFRELAIAEVNSIGAGGAMHTVLADLPGLAYSEYAGPDGLGELHDGIRNEDVTRLTYPDASFDLVLSSDTLEHVPDPDAAFRECRRVLRPGGRLLLTVPMLPLYDVSRRRAEMGPDGPRDLVPPQLHGYGSGPFRYIRRRKDAYLVFTDFGRDVVGRLAEAGLESTLARGPEPGHLGDAGIVISAVRPAEGAQADGENTTTTGLS